MAAEGPADEVLSRLVYLTHFTDGQPSIDLVLRDFGLAWPASAESGAPELSDAEVRRLRSAAAASQPPKSLLQAVELIRTSVPASPARLAMLVAEARLTRRAVHPSTLTAGLRLWQRDGPRTAIAFRSDPSGRSLGRGIIFAGAYNDTAAFQALNVVVDRVRRDGAASAMTVSAWLHEAGWPHASTASLEDALDAWGLVRPGSPIAWDRHVSSRLERQVLRLLAVAGPVAVAEIETCLAHLPIKIRPQVPRQHLLIRWAEEHPLLECGDGRQLELAAPPSEEQLAAWLSPVDRSILSRMRGGSADTADLISGLIQDGVHANASTAKSAVHTAPYLHSAGYGRRQLVGGRRRLSGGIGVSDAGQRPAQGAGPPG